MAHIARPILLRFLCKRSTHRRSLPLRTFSRGLSERAVDTHIHIHTCKPTANNVVIVVAFFFHVFFISFELSVALIAATSWYLFSGIRYVK